MHSYMYQTKSQVDFSVVYSDNMWEIHSLDQSVTFALSVALGAILCGVYDIIRAFRVSVGNSGMVIAVQDVIFCFTSSVATFLFLLVFCSGEIRSFVLLGEGIGFAGMRFTLSRLIFVAFSYVFRVLNSLTSVIKQWYIVFLTRFYSFWHKIFKTCEEKNKNISKVIKKLLKKIGSMMYTKRNND